MSNKTGPLHIVIGDDGYHLSTNSGDASYTLNGIPKMKLGIIDNLPDRLHITDKRSLPSASNVSAAPIAWGCEVKWQWPKEADESWHASVRASWACGEDATHQGKRISYPETAYKITGVPAGVDIAASITLHNGNGRRSQPAEVSTKSSDDAAKFLDGMFTTNNSQVFIESAFIRSGNNGTYKINSGVKAETTPDSVRQIVSKYLTGESTEYEDEMVEELLALFGQSQQSKSLTALVNEQIRQRLNKELQPGGLLHKR